MTLPKTDLLLIAFLLGAGVLFMASLSGCERPSSPDFEVEQVYTLPLVKESRYRFLGSADAFIDTTSSDFEDLFNTDENDLVRLGLEVDFDFGDVSGVVPDTRFQPLDIDPVLEIPTPDIEGVEELDFQDITGLNPGSFPTGTPISSGSSQVDIPMNSGIVSAEVQSGNIALNFTNELGFNISNMTITLVSGGTPTNASVETGTFPDGTTSQPILNFSNTNLEEPISLNVEMEWADQNMASDPENLNVGFQGDNIILTEAEAEWPSQTLFKEFESAVDDDQFIFTGPDDYVDLSGGVFLFKDLINEIDLDFDRVTISFPSMFYLSEDGFYDPADTVTVVLENDRRILRSSDPSNIDGVTFEEDIDRVRVFAPDNLMPVNVLAETEDTRDAAPGDRVRQLIAGQGFSGEITFEPEKTEAANGLVVPRFFSLNVDEPELELDDPEVRTVTTLEDLEYFSSRISGLDFVDPELTLHYTTELGIPSRVYGAFLGIDEDGNEVYLSGLAGSDYFVSPDDTVSGLLRNGAPIPNENLIAFTAPDASSNQAKSNSGSVPFNPDNSNIVDFLSNFPTEIWFISRALANPDLQTGFVELPIDIETMMTVDVPFSILTQDGPAAFTDSISTSLSDLPGQGDDTEIISAILTISYQNRLPLDVVMDIDFLDDLDEVITTVPLVDDEPIQLLSAPTGSSGFSDGVSEDQFMIELTEDQLRELNQTNTLLLRGQLVTSDFEPVNIRSSDSLSFSVRGRFEIRARVN